MKDEERRQLMNDISLVIKKEMEQERQKIAEASRDEFWNSFKKEVGGSVIRKVLWLIFGLALATAYLKAPWK